MEKAREDREAKLAQEARTLAEQEARNIERLRQAPYGDAADSSPSDLLEAPGWPSSTTTDLAGEPQISLQTLQFDGDTSGLWQQIQQGPHGGFDWGPRPGSFDFERVEWHFDTDRLGESDGPGVGITISGAIGGADRGRFFANGGALTIVIPINNPARWDVYASPTAQFQSALSIAAQITAGPAREAFLGTSNSLDIGPASFTI